MKEFEIIVDEWLGPSCPEKGDLATVASLRIEAGGNQQRRVVTEVYDALAQTVRKHVNVSGFVLARWLLLNWWRLCYEPRRNSLEWRLAHSFASMGDGYAWPPLTICGDGQFIELSQKAEQDTDVAAIRYLTELETEVPLADVEESVDRFVNQVQERLIACRSQNQDLDELRRELQEERNDPQVARKCYLQARAGFHPGEAPGKWQEELEEIGRETGTRALDEVAAVLPDIPEAVKGTRDRVKELRDSPYEVDLSGISVPEQDQDSELPWQKGIRLARQVRQQLPVQSGPLENKDLGDLLSIEIPVGTPMKRHALGGAFFENGKRAKVDVPGRYPESQRFHLARVIASKLLSTDNNALLPVTSAYTAMQKAERAFAQELLCPWKDLDAFTQEKGIEEEALAEACEYFQVSEYLVRSALVNNKKVSRDFLPATS